jgi:hypothetical protein
MDGSGGSRHRNPGSRRSESEADEASQNRQDIVEKLGCFGATLCQANHHTWRVADPLAITMVLKGFSFPRVLGGIGRSQESLTFMTPSCIFDSASLFFVCSTHPIENTLIPKERIDRIYIRHQTSAL